MHTVLEKKYDKFDSMGVTLMEQCPLRAAYGPGDY